MQAPGTVGGVQHVPPVAMPHAEMAYAPLPSTAKNIYGVSASIVYKIGVHLNVLRRGFVASLLCSSILYCKYV